MSQPVLLNPQEHSSLHIRPRIDPARFGSQQVLPLVVHEFAQAGSDCPIVFVKNAQAGQMQAVELVGVAPNENLMLRGDEWQGGYLPGALRLDPLRLVRGEVNPDQMAVGIDPDSPLVSETEGELLFDAEGEPTQFLSAQTDLLGQYFEQGQVTAQFLEQLSALGLLRSQELSMELRGEKFSVAGIQMVDENKLRELPDETVLDLHRRGFLQAIHSHLMSLHQVRRLAKIKMQAE